MCGRYHLSEKAKEHIKGLVEEQSEVFGWEYHDGDIHPTDMATILVGKQSRLVAENMKWGFPEKTLLINARAETVLERRTFTEGIQRRRCVIPASHFYEWDKEKNKVTFTLKDDSIIYMAGFYELYNGENHFIIITTAANESVTSVHDRMPLILQEKQIRDWIYRDDKLRTFLNAGSPQLRRQQEYEQLSLFETKPEN